MDKKDGGPAFPQMDAFVNANGERPVYVAAGGMTLRDKFAEAALPAEMVRAFRIMADGATEECWRDSVAKRCYEQADAMLRAREA